MICEKCGKDLPGFYCDDCGIIYDDDEVFVPQGPFRVSKKIGPLKIDYNNKQWRVKEGTVYRFDQIKDFSVFDKSTTTVKTKAGSAVGRAAVGGLLFGPVGAIVGGSTAKKKVVNDFAATVCIYVYGNPSPVKFSVYDQHELDRIANVLNDILDDF